MMTDAEITAMLNATDLDAVADAERARREEFLTAPENAEKVARLRARLDLCVQMHAIRKAANLTQKEIAERMHTHQAYIADLERGRKNLTFDTLISYANACGKKFVPHFA